MSTVATSTSFDREQLILSQLSQVQLLAARLHRRCPKQVDLEDLVSAGTVGLIQAVDRFDSQRGYKLKTLAEHRIRGAMMDYLRKLDPLPRSARHFVRERERVRTRLEVQLARVPEASEIADAMEISIEKYRRLDWMVRAANTVSVEALRRGTV